MNAWYLKGNQTCCVKELLEITHGDLNSRKIYELYVFNNRFYKLS